eukprot:TRINITY_DN11679_c0_g1_i1.p1 TRINITY_DN11679_c0_g1~~TRINITY_DN11679_c0_g1_i1.p1  ORF type:complete len:338 (-),score=43.04 TRINITY_DN11679_c0_g1_i1:140-1153(-)
MAPRTGKKGSLREYTSTEVSKHSSTDDAWVIIDGKVYNITTFIDDHPGGDVLEEYLGGDASEVMRDGSLHSHSDAAYELLVSYLIGVVPDLVARDGAVDLDTPKVTPEAQALFDKIDYTRGLAWQAPMLGKYYDQWVHTPLPPSMQIRYFDSDFFEYFSKMKWYFVPIFWLPVVLCCLWFGYQGGVQRGQGAVHFAIGLAIWCVAEYVLHKYVFHMAPRSRPLIWFHFMLHGSHHLAPMDKQRLVFPIIPAIITSGLIGAMMKPFFTPPASYLAFAGVLTGYIVYDLTHYYVHHGYPVFEFMKRLKTHHLHHHYKNQQMNFGISSPILDVVFQTKHV